MTNQKYTLKLIALLSVLAVVSYITVTLSFVLPDGSFKSSLSAVNQASSPFFNQTWNIFAPNIAKTNPSIRFQVQWEDETGERVKSDWVNLTEIEVNAVKGHFLPSRVHKTSWNMLSRYQNRYSKLSDDQKKIVKDTFIKKEGDSFASKSFDELLESLNSSGEKSFAAADFLRYDEMMREYITYFAAAYFSDHKIVRVRWQIFREYPNDFQNRKSPELIKEPTEINFGWRLAFESISSESLHHFSDVIERYSRVEIYE